MSVLDFWIRFVMIWFLCIQMHYCLGYQYFHNTAQAALQRVELAKLQITGNISNFYKYTYNGRNDNEITDGGGDMYDGGNKVYVWSGATVQPSESVMYEKYYKYNEFEFMSTKGWPFTALMYVNGSETLRSYYMRVKGNAGADGGGSLTHYDSLSPSACGKYVKFYSTHIYNAGDPSICEVIFAFGNRDELRRSFVLETRPLMSTDTTDATVKWISTERFGWMGYTLLSRSSGGFIQEAEVIESLGRIIEPILDCHGRYCIANNITCLNGKCKILNEGTSYACECSDGYYGITCGDFLNVSVGKRQVAVAGDGVFSIEVTVVATEIPVMIYLYQSTRNNGSIENVTAKGNDTQYLQLFNISRSMEGNYTILANTKSGHILTINFTFIVHENARIDNVDPRFTYSPKLADLNEIVCRVDGNPLPVTNWYRNGALVSKGYHHTGVFQTRNYETGDAYLDVTNALPSDNGTYTCRTINSVGIADSLREIAAFATAELSVYRSPEIRRIDNVSTRACTGGISLEVEWTPNNLTNDVTHRIIASSLNTSMTHTISTIAHRSTLLIENLLPLTAYNIKIVVCPDDCIWKLNATRKVVTSEKHETCISALAVSMASVASISTILAIVLAVLLVTQCRRRESAMTTGAVSIGNGDRQRYEPNGRNATGSNEYSGGMSTSANCSQGRLEKGGANSSKIGVPRYNVLPFTQTPINEESVYESVNGPNQNFNEGDDGIYESMGM